MQDLAGSSPADISSSTGPAATMSPIPITIITGFLGSGKTTLILKLIPQLPPMYRLALIKNEFGDVAVDSQLASTSAISGVKELLNGCICCNLIGSLADALEALSNEQNPDRFIIETSGSAFPATLAMEVNRIAKSTGMYVLDGVVSVIDVENWKGYEDTSYTAKVQAQYTDLLVLNKWELVSERALEDCIDRILDLDLDTPTPRVKSSQGWVDKSLLLGLDAKLAKAHNALSGTSTEHKHDDGHTSEVEVLSINLDTKDRADTATVDTTKLSNMLRAAPRDEVYRIKAVLYASEAPESSSGEKAERPGSGGRQRYILNWAFGRWNFTAAPIQATEERESVVRMTVVTARHEARKWKSKIEAGDLLAVDEQHAGGTLTIKQVT